jgi:hypothetical protein
MRRETAAERAAWTAHVEGQTVTVPTKYGNVHTHFNGRWFDSIHEARRAQTLQILERGNVISNVRYQVPFELVPKQGKIKPVRYVADFVYESGSTLVVEDAKGMKTPVYRLKKKLMLFVHGIDIQEV